MVLKKKFSIIDEAITGGLNHIIIIKFLSRRVENVPRSPFICGFISFERELSILIMQHSWDMSRFFLASGILDPRLSCWPSPYSAENVSSRRDLTN